MPSKRPKIIAGELYHVYNRSVEKRVLFPSVDHYIRFINALRFFNTIQPVNLRDFIQGNQTETTGIRPLLQNTQPIVQIGSFTLLPTHYHFLIRPLILNGLSLFMQKLGAGYACFFNLKHSRSGTLFQGRYKVKLIDHDQYGRHIQAYIALNILDYVMPEWRENGINNKERARKFLREYKWSSFAAYMGKKQFPGIIDPKFLSEFFDTPYEFEEFTLAWAAKDSEFIHNTLIKQGSDPCKPYK